MRSPTSPHAGPPSLEPEGVFDGLQWSAIALGALLDNVLTFVALVPIALYTAGPDAFSEDTEAADRAFQAAEASPEYLLLTLVVGLGITVYAGFYAARRAGNLHVRHGGWAAVVSLAFASALYLLPGVAESGSPLWYDALGMALMVPAGALGGWLASRIDAPREG